MAESINAVRMTKKYKPLLDVAVIPGARIINYANKATGRDCDLCRHVPEKRPPKPGYPDVSEEMRLMRVKLPVGTKDTDVGVGKEGFTVTGDLIELNVCKDFESCFTRALDLRKDDGSLVYPDLRDSALGALRR